MDLSVVNIFTNDECDRIITSIEDNVTKLRVSNENGWHYLSAYEMQTSELPVEIVNLIKSKIKQFDGYEIVHNFIIKYDKDLITGMGGHYDGSYLSLPINLNNDFSGGETHLPFLNYLHVPQNHSRGNGILFRADKLKSWHKALPITKGSRYVLVLKFNNKKNILLRMLTILKLVVATKIIETFIYKKPLI